MSDRVTIDVSGGVADVRLNRPEKMNALDPAMFSAIAEAGETVKADPSIRAVVLSGEGRAFCAGLDFSSFQAMAGSGGDGGGGGAASAPRGESRAQGETASILDMSGRITHLGQQTAYVWQEVPVPVIAAVHGHCLGGGIQIALGADIRIVAPDAQMSVLEVRWGLIPDMTGTATLPRLVGIERAKELTWTGRMVSGEEAVRIGLASQLADSPRDAALALAAELAGKSPHALRGSKKLLDQSGSVPLAQQLADERSTIGALIGSPNQIEAVTAFFEKRAPAFTDPA